MVRHTPTCAVKEAEKEPEVSDGDKQHGEWQNCLTLLSDLAF